MSNPKGLNIVIAVVADAFLKAFFVKPSTAANLSSFKAFAAAVVIAKTTITSS